MSHESAATLLAPWLHAGSTCMRRPLRTAIGNATWTMPVIHGFWQQRTIEALGRMLRVTLVARRSRQFAGTRYRRRGINSSGHVANDVETEQIVYAGRDWGTGFPVVSSVVQVAAVPHSPCKLTRPAALLSHIAQPSILLAGLACHRNAEHAMPLRTALCTGFRHDGPPEP